jgi:ATP-binding cassette subfamily B protein
VVTGRLARAARAVISLMWAASPSATLSMVLLAVAGGLTPTAAVWLQRGVLNGLVPSAAGHQGARSPAPHGVSAGHIVALALLLGAVGLVTAITPYGQTYAESALRRGLSLIIPDRMFAAINAFPGISRFESPEFADKIRLVQQSGTSANRLISSGLLCAQSLITAVTMLGTLEVINRFLALIVGCTVVPAVVAQISNARQRVGLEWRKSPSMRRQLFYSQLMCDRDAAKEVRLFGLGDFLRGRMLAEVRSVNRGQRVLDLRILTLEGSLSLAGAIITAFGTVWVVRQAVAGQLSVGDVSVFALSVVGVQRAISGMVSRLASVYESTMMFEHYLDIVSVGPDLSLVAAPRPLPPLRGAIEVRDVWFRYDDDHPWVLRGVNLTIPAGQSVALIGLNGAGKSTLVKLLCRLYDPVRGDIFWDGVNIREISPGDLRARIGTVFQDYMSYDLTASENIGLGDLEHLASLPRIQAAAAAADIHDKLASLPRGYDTLLSRIFLDRTEQGDPETGVILSGGQWQRLAVARGFMRADRDVLILDEPSSGMDAEAEHDLHRRLCAMRAGRTSLLISHRLGSVRDADVIYVLRHGQVAEQGTHGALMAARGEYHRLFTLQGRGYLADGEDGPEPAAPGRQTRPGPAGSVSPAVANGVPAGKPGLQQSEWRARTRARPWHTERGGLP